MTDITIKVEQIEKNIKGLTSENPLIFKDTLVNIRENGNKSYIPVLIDLLLKNKGNESGDLIRSFIADIKESYLEQFIIDCINDSKYNSIKKELLSICWESAVKFDKHVELFIEIIINDNFDCAFEALTIIEHLESVIEDNIIKTQVDKLKSAIKGSDESRKYLIYSTINILEERIA